MVLQHHVVSHTVKPSHIFQCVGVLLRINGIPHVAKEQCILSTGQGTHVISTHSLTRICVNLA